MQRASAEEEQHIKTLIREYVDGESDDFEKIKYTLYNYAYILTKPVFLDETISKHVAEHILKRLEENLSKIKPDTDFYLWFTLFCVYRMYRIINSRGTGYNEIDHKDTYQHNKISEDQALAEAAARYFDQIVYQNEDNGENLLNTSQRLLLEMYSLLDIDVKKIARLCKTEPVCIQNELGRIRSLLVPKTERVADSDVIVSLNVKRSDEVSTQQEAATIAESSDHSDRESKDQLETEKVRKIENVDPLFPPYNKKTQFCINITLAVGVILTLLVTFI